MGPFSSSAIRFVVLFCLTICSYSEAAEIQAERQQKREALRRYLGRPSGSVKKPVLKTKPPTIDSDLRSQALSEIKADEKAFTPEPIGSATVITQKIEAKDPVAYQGLQIGLTARAFTPKGRVPIVAMGYRELDQHVGRTWLLGGELRVMPYRSELFKSAVGFRAGLAYAGQNLTLFTLSGRSLGPSRLHSLESYFTVSQNWVWNSFPRWSFELDLGISRFDSILASQNSLANESDHVWAATALVGPKVRLGDFWLSINYQHREPVSRGDWFRVNEQSLVFGAQYAVR